LINSSNSAAAQFVFAVLGIMPLAGIMGDATESVADHMGPGVGGLLNATFGNATEMIIGIFGVFRNLDSLLKASLTGSIVGNILLVLGTSILAGGIKYEKQVFNKVAAGSSSTILVVCAMAMLIPATFHGIADNDPNGNSLEHRLSLSVSILLVFTYACLLFFQLKTHAKLFADVGHVVVYKYESELKRDEALEAAGVATKEAEEEEEPMSLRRAAVVLFVTTVLVAGLSEVLTGQVEEAGKQLNLTEEFMGMVVVAIVGNVAEHTTAILMAYKNKMDLSISIAFGSALQISLFAVPVLVLLSYARSGPAMHLLFSQFEVFALAVSCVLAWMVVSNGESNWLQGLVMLTTYISIALGFYFLPQTAV